MRDKLSLNFKEIIRRELHPYRTILKEGVPIEKLISSISVGTVSGLFPLIGLTSVVCFFLTIARKQNAVIAQTINWLLTPVQLLLIIPFMRLGATLLMREPIKITLKEIINAFSEGVLHGFATVGILHVYAILSWAIIAIPLLIIVQLALPAGIRLLQKF